MSHLTTGVPCCRIMPFFMYITTVQCTFVGASLIYTPYCSVSGLTVIGWSDSQQQALHEMEQFRQTTQSPTHTLLYEHSSTSAWGNDRQVERGEKSISLSQSKSVSI